MTKSVLFHRDLLDFSGGHLKVFDYFQHVQSSSNFRPQIYFTESSIWTRRNPWFQGREAGDFEVRKGFDIEDADVLFLAGFDWLALSPEQRKSPGRPVINLIQHVRHADPQDDRYPFLVHPATRLCVSQEVADAVSATGKANGPVLAISNGLDFSDFPPVVPRDSRPYDAFIVGIKQLSGAQKLCRKMRKLGLSVDLLDKNAPREEFLRRLSQARTAVFFPDPTEGFYLPPLEAMYLETLVICPDCEGNRVFCHDQENCLQPKYSPRAMFTAVKRVQQAEEPSVEAMIAQGLKTASAHDIKSEREAFLRVLSELT